MVDVLLIEDNFTDADLTLRALKKRNVSLNVVHLEDGVQALDYLFPQGSFSEGEKENFPKLILMDLQLPKINGHEVLKRIKQSEATKMIPILIFTSSNQQKDILECYQSGTNGYMVKALDFEEYIQQISKAVDFWIDINYTANY